MEKCETCKEAELYLKAISNDDSNNVSQAIFVAIANHLKKYHCTCKETRMEDKRTVADKIEVVTRGWLWFLATMIIFTEDANSGYDLIDAMVYFLMNF